MSTSEAEPTGSERSSPSGEPRVIDTFNPPCGTCPHGRASHPDEEAGYGCIGNRNFCNCPKYTNGYIDMCRCGHRRGHHGYGPDDSTEAPVLPTGPCLVDETGKGRCECTGFMAPLATIVAAADTIADFHDALDKVIKRETECVSCVDGVFDCTCGEADEPENCTDCRHLPISHGDDGCRHCDCAVGALVPEPELICPGCKHPDSVHGDSGCTRRACDCTDPRWAEDAVALLESFNAEGGWGVSPPGQTEVEYAVQGGETFAIRVPQGVTVTAVDGVLKLNHQQKPVLGIVRVRT